MSESKKNNDSNDTSISERFSVPQTSASVPMPKVKPPKDDNSKSSDGE